MIKIYLKRFQDFYRYGQSYNKGIYLSIIILIIIAIFGTINSLKHADTTSIQAGLTIIAEILGVLLGAVLIIVVLLIEQRQRAEEHLRGAYPKYRCKIRDNIAIVEKAYKQLIILVRNKKIQLDEPIFVGPSGIPSQKKYRNIVGSLAGLIIAINSETSEQQEKDLADLGFTEEEQNEYLYGKGALSNYDPADFLKLIDDALDSSCLIPCCSDDVGDFAADIFQECSNDGVSQAISHFERSRKVLKSKSLAACMTLILASIALAVVMLFGVTQQTLTATSTILLVIVVIIGFFISILLTLLLTQKMFI